MSNSASESFKLLPGKFYPQGAVFDGEGVNFAVFSEYSDKAELVLFDPKNPKLELARLPLRCRTEHVWHGYVPGLLPGALYSYRFEGPNRPEEGLRFDSEKLLIDPYAKALVAEVEPGAAQPPPAVVVDDKFDWGSDKPPAVAWDRTFIYELHVKGFSQLHPEIPAELRGRYTGLCHPAALAHFKKLGVTAVELLPVHEFVDEGFLRDKGLKNYWGYNSIGFFAPSQRYASRPGSQVTDFKEMVKGLHAAGIEVILDVVYNHTAEGNHQGPTLSFRGVDNLAYYRLAPDDLSKYVDSTGTGNSLNLKSPQALRLVLDSLRYWATEMHVDGFRFDLATTLARDSADYERESGFLRTIHQDPILSHVKLIAEPWDVGPGGYQVGNFPVRWSEWNGRYRDTLRKFWKGDEGQLRELGYRLTGSSDLFELGGRSPRASINFISVHDGFTLHDLVSYNEKHNEANGEENHDGSDDNQSWNCGVEGETDDPAIAALREQQQRNFLATLFFSQGVPMLYAGDEMGNTQGGNNNAYCQDTEISWIDWKLDDRRKALLEFTAQVSALRRAQPALRPQRFSNIEPAAKAEQPSVSASDSPVEAWLKMDGCPLTLEEWGESGAKSVALFMRGDRLRRIDARGNFEEGDTLLLLLNASDIELPFTLPPKEWGASWETLVDTARPETKNEEKLEGGTPVKLAGRSLCLLRRS